MAAAQTELQAQDFWNKYAAEYTRKSVAHSMQVLRQIMSLLKLESSTSLVEAGCGGGESFAIYRELLPASTKIFANDYSQEMVTLALAKNSENVEIVLASNQALPYNNEVCDRYVANLSLHIVPDARMMLREALRVLKPGGLAGFSVWGMKNVANLFVLQEKAAIKAGLSGNARSLFHLNNQQELNSMLREEGFVEVRSYYTAVGIDIFNEEEAVEYAIGSPPMAEMKEKNPEMHERLVGYIRDEAKIALDAGHIITFDALIAFGQKP